MDAMEWAESKVERLDAVDLALIKWSCLVGGVLLTKWIPGLRKVPTGLLVLATLGLAAKPMWDAYGDD